MLVLITLSKTAAFASWAVHSKHVFISTYSPLIEMLTSSEFGSMKVQNGLTYLLVKYITPCSTFPKQYLGMSRYGLRLVRVKIGPLISQLNPTILSSMEKVRPY